MPGDICVPLAHVVPDAKLRTLYLRKRQDGELPEHNGEHVVLETTIHDGRNKGLALDEAAFELFQHPTALATKDFYGDAAKISTAYYTEMRALLARATGSSHVHVFHHQVRNQERAVSGVGSDGSRNTNTPVQPYAQGIHTDSSCFHAEGFFKSMVAQMPSECQRGRFLYVNAWRNIVDEPIEDNHLAVLDERSLVKPDDYIQQHLFGVGYEVLQYALSARNARCHRWYYFPRMAKDEVLLFKQWDSDPLRSGRVCFHTSVRDPTAPAGAPSRQSIEVRALVFFPEHEPNTCPVLPARSPTAEGECDEETARSVAGKLVYAIPYIESQPSLRLTVTAHLKGMYQSRGPAAVLREFAEDRQGKLGSRDASAATKARVVELAIEMGVGRQVDKFFSGPSALQLAGAMFWNSRLAVAVVGATAGAALTLAVKRG